MTWRTVIISERAKLELKMNYLVVRRPEETVKVFLDEIAIVMIESTAVSLTVALLSELTQRKIKVVFCDHKRNPSSELMPYYGSHDTSNKIRRQVSWDLEFSEMIWAEIIREKINKQAKLLEKIGSNRYLLLNTYTQEVAPYDKTNREGHAAKVYFNELFGLDFTRTADSFMNDALNYGYTILLSAFNREIVANGYITQMGLFHDNMFNPFNLASDLMEPFRPLIDERVYKIQPDKFDKEEKYELIDVLNKTVLIDNKKQTVLNSIRIYCKSIFEALDQNDLSCVRFYRNEL